MSTGWWDEHPLGAETNGTRLVDQLVSVVSSQGQFSINLIGTGLKVAEATKWTSQGNYVSVKVHRSKVTMSGLSFYDSENHFFFSPGGVKSSVWMAVLCFCLIHWRGISADISTLSILCVITLPFSHSVPSRLPSSVGRDKNLRPLWRFLWEVHSPGSQRSPPASPLKPRPRTKPRPAPRCWTPVPWALKACLRSIIHRKLPSSLMAAKGSVDLQSWATGPLLGPPSKLQKKPTWCLLTVNPTGPCSSHADIGFSLKHHTRDILVRGEGTEQNQSFHKSPKYPIMIC